MPSLYLHIPFCEAKCIYCDFNSYAHQEHLYAPFVDAAVRRHCARAGAGVLRRLAPAPDGGGRSAGWVRPGGAVAGRHDLFRRGHAERVDAGADRADPRYLPGALCRRARRRDHDGGQPRHDQRGQVRGLPGGGGQPAEHGRAELRRRDAEALEPHPHGGRGAGGVPPRPPRRVRQHQSRPDFRPARTGRGPLGRARSMPCSNCSPTTFRPTR